MIKILLGSCHELISQKIINDVCNYFICKFELDKNDLFFFSTNGRELGDVLCKNYLDYNGFPRQLIPPMSATPSIMQECEHAIVFDSGRDTDAGHSNGVRYCLPYLATNIKSKLIVVHLNCNTISVYDCARKCSIEQISPVTYCYEFDENDKITIDNLATVMRQFKKKRMIVSPK